MKNVKFLRSEKSNKDPTYRYIFAAACILFLHIIFRYDTQFLHEHLLIIPCLLYVGNKLHHNDGNKTFHIPWLSIIMVVWFVLLQAKRYAENTQHATLGAVLSTYLFAFPLAYLMQDGEKKNALKIFAGTYLAAAIVLAIDGLLLVLDCLPEFLSDGVAWNGARLDVFWHANAVACFLLIGIVFCSAFLSQAKSFFSKLTCCFLEIFLFAIMALTNCRTAIILTGGYLGITFFFMMIKRGRRWFIPGILAVLILPICLYLCASHLYQTNSDALLKKYTQQYLAQTTSSNVEATSSDTKTEVSTTEEPVNTETVAHEEETLPIKIDSDTGEVSHITHSPQGSLIKNLNSLNGRTRIWGSTFYAICENPDILYWGTFHPGSFVTSYHTGYVPHLHNSWIECLVGLGVVGFNIAVLFTLQTIWNCLVTFLKNYDDVWKRSVALLALCLIVAAVVEPYLFGTNTDYQPFNFIFFLCAGYLAHWQEAYNRRLLAKIRNKIPFLKK